MKSCPFTLDIDVRDYECDFQGIVNNAVYQNYLEHARHVYLKTRGMDVAALAGRGIILVVTRIEMDFLRPLRGGDRFRVSLRMERVSRLRFGFLQEIHRLPDGQPVLKARVIGTSMGRDGRPRRFPEVEVLLGDIE